MIWLYLGFVGFVLLMLAIDLFVVNREAHDISIKAALAWTGVCVVLALAFGGVVYAIYEHNWMGLGDQLLAARAERPSEVPIPPEGAPHGAAVEAGRAFTGPGQGTDAVMQFYAGWLTEYALSVDNIFVIALIFTHFRIPTKYQHRVLFWGILGALILRGVMIGAGAQLVTHFSWILYIFGGILIYTAYKILRGGEDHFDPEKSLAYRLGKRLFNFTPDIQGQAFIVRRDGVRYATPLLLVLFIVEGTDVVFAIDSIPAIFSLTQDPFLVFTSNVFAILGLRSLYFALSGLMGKFGYIKFSLAFILAFVGVKMLLEFWHIRISSAVSLSVIGLALAAGVASSIALPSDSQAEAEDPKGPPSPEATQAATGSVRPDGGGNA